MNLFFDRLGVMKKLLAILVLTLCLTTPSQANDIRDFQIEGMSVGDSLLDYMSKEEIEKKRSYFKYKRGSGKGLRKEYSKTSIRDKNKLNTYDSIYIYFKSDDQRYIIQSLSGRIYFPYKIEKCHSLQSKIVKDISPITINATERKIKDQVLSEINRKLYNYYFNDGSAISIACYEYLKFAEQNRLSVVTQSIHYNNFQKNLDYN